MEITVGIDVSKARLDVHVHPADESFAVGNDEAGVEALVERLGKLEELIGIGLEASGRYERLAVAQLAAIEQLLGGVMVRPSPAVGAVAAAPLEWSARAVGSRRDWLC